MIKVNNRLNNIQEYHFKKIGDMKRKLIKDGKKIIDFGIGDPDIKINPKITEALINALSIKNFNRYPPYSGIDELKLKIIKYYKDIFNVNLKLDEVIITIGSKEGISSIIPSICNIGDYVLVPNPSYQVYTAAAYLWGALPYEIPLTEKNNYLPDFSIIPNHIVQKSKLFFINYPNNPTGATANSDFFKEIVKFCREKNIVLINDSAYIEIIKSSKKPLSLLQNNGNENIIELGSFSKTYSMTGFRIGYAVGDRNVIAALSKVKSNIDSGQFMPVQYAASAALDIGREEIKRVIDIYWERKLKAQSILRAKGIKYFNGEGTFYIWCSVPKGYNTDEFCDKLLSKYGVIVTPGYCFGDLGYGFFRLALTTNTLNIETALSNFEYFK